MNISATLISELVITLQFSCTGSKQNYLNMLNFLPGYRHGTQPCLPPPASLGHLSVLPVVLTKLITNTV